MNYQIHSCFLLIFFIQQSSTQIPPVVPLTNALTAVYCHNSDDSGVMTIRCGPNEKIRMLDAFDATAKNRSRLPSQCSKERQSSSLKDSTGVDCKVHTSFTSACSGRENCTLHMQRIRLNNAKDNCHNELVDYTMAFFECISDVFIHNVCSSQAITSAWGTLQTPNFPNPYTSSDDCWCKLSTQLKHRLLLSIIVFQLIPSDQHCAGAGLYLQSSDEQRSTQCTYLQQGHNYLSDTNSLFINFYSRTSTVRGGFWIIYEASHPNAEVHLHCGSRDKIGVPSTSLNSISPSSFSTPYDHGWSRLAFNNPPNPTTPNNDHMMRLHMSVTTPSSFLHSNSKINTSTAIGAFTYPHGALTTFEVAYGPRGWFLKHPFDSSSKTSPNSLRTTTKRVPLPVVKWNYTWRYTRPTRTKLSKTTDPPITTTTTTTTIKTTESTTVMMTTFVEENTMEFTTTPIPTTTPRPVTAHQRLLFTHRPWIFYNFSGSPLLSTSPRSIIKSTTHKAALSALLKTTYPLPTPWYSPAGPFDWWQWQWYTTKNRKSSLKSHSTKPKTTTTTATMSTRTTERTTTNRSTTAGIRLPNNTSSQPKVVVDQILSSTKTSRSDDLEKEYKDWLEYLTTNEIQEVLTSTTISVLTSISPRQQYPQMGYLPTQSNWKIITVDTPPAKRQHSSNPVASERNAIAMQTNGEVTSSNVHNMIRRVIEQRNKKHALEYGWLSKTDLTIVAVSILFVILLAIINLILFAVRRHRHRLQGRHLLSTSISSSLNDQRRGGNGHSHGSTFGDATNSLINVTNGNNNDILPAVGEIVIWDEKDQGGYMIDNNGAWAKIEGRQWFGSNLFKSCSKTSITKSFRSRFRFIRHLDKKNNHHQHQPPISPKTQQQTFKFPLLMDTTTLSPVPEADDYESSDLSLSDIVIRSSTTTVNLPNKRSQQQQSLMKSQRRRDLSPQMSKTIQALIHTDPQNDDYYKRIGNNGEDSNYSGTGGRGAETPSIGDQETDRSLGNEMDAGGPVVVSVPTMIRGDNDAGMNTDGGDSIYNPNYCIQSLVENSHPNYLQPNNHTALFSNKPSISTFKPTMNNQVIIGFCQSEFQPLDPKLLFKSPDKTSLMEQQQTQFFRCTQSVQLSTYDSGFVDDQTVESSTTANPMSGSDNNLISEHMHPDDILLTKSETVEDDDEDEDYLSGHALEINETRNSKRQKWKAIAKRVSFPEEHVTQRFSPLPSSIDTTLHPEISSSPLDTYDTPATALSGIPIAPPLVKSFLSSAFHDQSSATTSIFTVQNQATSIDNEDNTQTIIMNHLHSVKSLKKFFETKMVVQRSPTSVLSQSILANEESKFDRSLMNNEQKPTDEFEQRHEMMNKVLESLKKKTVHARTTNDTPEPSGRYSAMTTSSYDSTLTQNLAVQRHYSRRFRSSSTSNNSLYPGGTIITHINLSNSHHNKRAHSHDRQYYQTTDHHLATVDRWKHEQQRGIDSDEEDNISENSMLWQARTKLNEFVTRTKKNQQQSPYYTTCINAGTPIDDLDIYDENESVTAETRF